MARWASDPEAPLDADDEGPLTLPARYYTDPAVLEAERERVFATTWQYLGDAGRFDDPGSLVVADLADRSVILARDEDGDLHGLHNVCAHRGSRIADGDATGQRRLQCPYHGWTYRLDGSLVAAPNFEADAIDADCNGLRAVGVDRHGPLLFASLDPDRDPLAGRLAPVAEALDPYAIDGFARVRTEEYEIDCNWKVYVDNYLECDHCHLNHPTFVDSLDMAGYEIAPGDTYVLQHGRMTGDSAMEPEAADEVDPEARDRYLSAWLWPNVTIDVTPRSLEVCRVRPDAPDRTTLVVDYYNRQGEPTDDWAEGFAFSQQVMREDIELCERQHAGLASGVFSQGRLGPEEHGVHRFQQLVIEALEAEGVAAP